MSRKVKQQQQSELLECVEAFAHQVPEFADPAKMQRLQDVRARVLELVDTLGRTIDKSAQDDVRADLKQARRQLAELEEQRDRGHSEIIGIKKGQLVRPDDPIVHRHEQFFRPAQILDRQAVSIR